MVGQSGGGRIVNISSVHEDLPMPTNAPYCAAKGGMRMLMRTIAVELAPLGVTVNNIAPGAVETPMDAKIEEDPEQYRSLLSEIPLGRMGKRRRWRPWPSTWPPTRPPTSRGARSSWTAAGCGGRDSLEENFGVPAAHGCGL
jgi:NAD(P)-dependent dehydrogenase (short-subunit alcohol dehydrogenase family)